MNNKERILWITHTAIFIALLIVLQATTAVLGNIIITGTIVNLLLIVSVMTCGLSSGITVAVIFAHHGEASWHRPALGLNSIYCGRKHCVDIALAFHR